MCCTNYFYITVEEPHPGKTASELEEFHKLAGIRLAEIIDKTILSATYG